jgi:subtilisin-like proprotein convertase family protein
VRTITIVAVALLLPMILLMPISQAKRAKKISSKQTLPQRQASKAILPSGLSSLMRPQDLASKPVSMRAVGFAVTEPVSEMKQKAVRSKSRKLGKDLEAFIPVSSAPQKNTSPPLSGITDSLEALLSSIQTDVPSPNAIPTPASTFEGLSNQDNFNHPAIAGRVIPPDTVGDVGPNHYVQAINLLFRVYNKSGVPLTAPQPISTLFTSLGGRCATIDDGDPIVLYDSFADRWIITQFVVSGAAPLGQCFAVSQTGDPTGAYFTYDFTMPNNKFNDYPKFGVWPDGYYWSNNQFPLAGPGFLGVGVFALDRAKLLAGDPTASFIYFDLEGFPGQVIRSMLPSDADGLNPPPAGAPNVFSYFNANEFTGETDSLRLFNFHADFAVPANSTFLERAESPVAVAAFDPRSPANLGDIEQPPPATSANNVDSISDRLMHRLQYRNFGTHESLIVNHTVNVTPVPGTVTAANHQAGVRYYELRRSGGAYSVNEQSTFAPDTHNRWMGSAAMDHQGNLAVGYSISSTTVHPGIRYAGRLSSDPANQLTQGEATLQAGSFVQQTTGVFARWGDYSSMNVDPTDDCTFWYTQEYYQANNPATSAEWQTRIGNFKVNPMCVAPAQGTLVVNVTNCATGLPVSGATISVDGNLYGASNAGGSFSAQLTPGTYSVTAAAFNYEPNTENGVIITNGGTNIVDLCLTPVPNIDPAGATITAESCSPNDNALSPGETVAVDFGLKNSGNAATTDLVATLLATGGVTSPSGPQSYGAIPPDNTTVVTRPFTFTVDPSVPCGSQVTATLQLQDGANDLGTVTFTFQVGIVGGTAPPATYSSGNVAVPIPDEGQAEVPINVSDFGVVADINVRVRLNHTFDGDLEIRLIAPDGTQVLLSDNRGGAGQNFGTGANDCSGTPTVFDDEAATPIASGSAPFAGSFRPDQPLSAMDGKGTNGTWRLRVNDTAGLDTGTIGCVTLEITRRRFVCCGVPGAPQIDAGPATLTNESCPPANNAIDPGERVTVNLSLTNNGDEATNNLVATLLPGGGVNAPSNPQSYGAMPPVPFPGSTATRDFSFTATGSCGSTLTATWQLNDGPDDLGTVTKTFQLGVTVNNAPQTFSNSTPITIPDTPAPAPELAVPYPSSIVVSGLSGPVSKVTVTLKNFSHTFPDDVDVLLVGPAGQKLILMSDAGGAPNQVNSIFTFDDAAAAAMPNTFPGANTDNRTDSGTYKPSNYDAVADNFPAPAPAGPHPDTQLSVFNGTNPNGTWSLYVVDDAVGDAGSISGGWDLTITTSRVECTTPCGIVRLVVTSTLSCVNATTVKATYQISNIGTADANNVTRTTARLGATNGTPPVQPIGNIPAFGASGFFDVFFSPSPAGASTLTLGGTYTNGNFSSTKRVTVPSCNQAAPSQLRE